MADIDKASQSDDAEHSVRVRQRRTRKSDSAAASSTKAMETTEKPEKTEKMERTEAEGTKAKRATKASGTNKGRARVSRKAVKAKNPSDTDAADIANIQKADSQPGSHEIAPSSSSSTPSQPSQVQQPTPRKNVRGRKSAVQKVTNKATTDKADKGTGDTDDNGIKNITGSNDIAKISEPIFHDRHENNTVLAKISEKDTEKSTSAQTARDVSQSRTRRQTHTVRARPKTSDAANAANANVIDDNGNNSKPDAKSRKRKKPEPELVPSLVQEQAKPKKSTPRRSSSIRKRKPEHHDITEPATNVTSQEPAQDFSATEQEPATVHEFFTISGSESETKTEPETAIAHDTRYEEASMTEEDLTALKNLNSQDGGELPITLEEAFKTAVVQPVQSHHRHRGRRHRPVAAHSNAASASPSQSSSSSKQKQQNSSVPAPIQMPSSPLWGETRSKKHSANQDRAMKREMQRAEQQLKLVAHSQQASRQTFSSHISSREQDGARETPGTAKVRESNRVHHGRARSLYPKEEFSSVEMMSSLNGFAPMGMLFVLMDILKGHEEGLVHVNQLAQSLGIGKPSLLAQLENLESAGLVRTISSSRAGRHLELLTPNMLAHDATDIFPLGTSGNLRDASASDNNIEVGGQFSNKRLDMLYRHLKKRGIEVVSIPDERTMPSVLPQLATCMGKYYPYLKGFYERLKMTLGLGEKFEFSLTNLPSRIVTHTLSFSRMLRKAGFFSEFLYQKAPHCKIAARISRAPNAINFLTGGWLEHYVRDKVISILTTHPVTLSMPYAFMKNPRIILPGDEQFELDFLLCVGEKIFWIESKTGDYLEYLPKYSRVSRLLGLSRNTSMLVSVESLNAEDKLTSRYNLSCCNMDEFPDVFRINLVREFQQLAVQSGIA